jgi:hypothetical protein
MYVALNTIGHIKKISCIKKSSTAGKKRLHVLIHLCMMCVCKNKLYMIMKIIKIIIMIDENYNNHNDDAMLDV